jgi:hypothetical protein
MIIRTGDVAAVGIDLSSRQSGYVGEVDARPILCQEVDADRRKVGDVPVFLIRVPCEQEVQLAPRIFDQILEVEDRAGPSVVVCDNVVFADRIA